MMREARQSIIEGTFPEFVQGFMAEYYPKRLYPKWAQDAFASVNVHLLPPSEDAHLPMDGVAAAVEDDLAPQP